MCKGLCLCCIQGPWHCWMTPCQLAHLSTAPLALLCCVFDSIRHACANGCSPMWPGSRPSSASLRVVENAAADAYRHRDCIGRLSHAAIQAGHIRGLAGVHAALQSAVVHSMCCDTGVQPQTRVLLSSRHRLLLWQQQPCTAFLLCSFCVSHTCRTIAGCLQAQAQLNAGGAGHHQCGFNHVSGPDTYCCVGSHPSNHGKTSNEQGEDRTELYSMSHGWELVQ